MIKIGTNVCFIPNGVDLHPDQLAIFYGEEEGVFYVLDPSTTRSGVVLLWARSMFQPFPSLAGAEWFMTLCYIISL